MKLVSVLDEGARLAGVLEGDEVYVTDVPGLDTAIAQGLDLKARKGQWRPLANLRLDAPLRPGSILATGSNYLDHVDERIAATGGVNAPEDDMEFFVKGGMTIAGLEDLLKLDPAIGAKIDQETEIALVIAPTCPRGVAEAQAMDHIFGYMVANDVTARDKQVRFLSDGSNFMHTGASKTFHGATRFSSYVVTADEIEDINRLDVRTYLNGQMTQNNNTANLINSFAHILAHFSAVLEFQGGEVIITGTPGGTGWGQDRELGGKGYVPPNCVASRYLRPGDEVRSVVESIGELVFRTA